MKTIRVLCLAALFTGLLTPLAQAQPASAAGTGSVTGHVLAGDTQRPARFAQVVLFGVPSDLTTAKKPDPDADLAAQMTSMAAAMQTLGKTQMVQFQTGTDGGFTATDVAPGDYYAFAAMAGYIAPLARVQALFEDGANPKQRLPGIPVVHVAAEHSSSVDITMDRGAAVSGSILWDDGSSLSGALMTATPAKADSAQAPAQFGMLAMAGIMNSLLTISDDQGHFRLSGLPPGDYLIQATIQAGQQTGLGSGMHLGKLMGYKPLIVFAPAAFHKTEGKPISLKTGEELRDQQITLNLGGLHSVSGQITSVEDHHGINSATVKLTDVSDKDFVRSASVDAAGHFTVTFVPPGTYTLKVSEAGDTEPEKKTGKEKASSLFGPGDKTIRSYQASKKEVIVADSDVTGQNLELMIDKDPKPEPDFKKLLNPDQPASPAPR